MNELAATLEDVRTDLSITEGRLGIAVEEAATVRLLAPEHTPLATAEPHLIIEVSGDGFDGSVRLDGEDVRTLLAVLQEDAP